MPFDMRSEYGSSGYNEMLMYDDLNRWSLHGSPQWLREDSFTTVSTQEFQGVFDMNTTTNYSHFKIIIQRMKSSGTGTLRLKFMDGATVRAEDCRFTRERITYAGVRTTTLGIDGTGTQHFNLMQLDATNESYGIIDVFNPHKAFRSQISATLTEGATTQGSLLVSGRMNNANLSDGFQLSVSTGTITGRVTVYAWRNGSA